MLVHICLQAQVEELLFCMLFALVLVVYFLVLFLLLVWVFWLVFFFIILKKESCVLHSQVRTLVNLNMRIPLSDGFLLLLFHLIKLSVVDSFLLELLEQYFLLLLLLFLNLLHYVFFILVFIKFCPNNGFPERYDWIWCLNRDFAVNLFKVNNAFFQMNLTGCVQNQITCCWDINFNRWVWLVQFFQAIKQLIVILNVGSTYTDF